MRLQHAFVPAAGVCLWFASSWMVQTSAPCAEFAPQKRSLAIPVSLVGKPAGAVQCVVTLGPAVPMSAVAFSPDGKKLAVGGYHEVLIWDLENAALARRIGAEQIDGAVGALAFLQDGQLAVGEGTPYGSGAVRVFNIENGQQTHSFEEPAEVVYCLAVSPNGELLAAGGADGLVRVWNVADKKLVATLEKHTDWVLGLSFSRDGKLLATASADRNALIWDVATWQSSVKLREEDTIHGVAIGSDPRYVFLAVGGPSQQTLQLRRTDNVRSRRPISTGAGVPLGAVGSRKANQVYVPCSDGTVKVYDDRNGRLLGTFAGHGDWVYCAALSPDETKLATGSGDGTVKVFNAATRQLVATLVSLAPQTDDWLILTADGHFSASSPNAIQWRTADSAAPPAEWTDGLESLDKVRQALTKNGRTAAPPKSQRRPKPKPKKPVAKKAGK